MFPIYFWQYNNIFHQNSLPKWKLIHFSCLSFRKSRVEVLYILKEEKRIVKLANNIIKDDETITLIKKARLIAVFF